MFNVVLKKIVVDFLSSMHNIFFVFSSFSCNLRKTTKSKALHSLAHTIGCSFERHCPPLPIPSQQHPHIIANLFAKCHYIDRTPPSCILLAHCVVVSRCSTNYVVKHTTRFTTTLLVILNNLSLLVRGKLSSNALK